MIFNEHLEIEGTHAFLGASHYQYLDYTDEELVNRFVGSYAQMLGTALHEVAALLIKKHVTLTKADRKVVLVELLNKKIPEYVIDLDRIYPNFMAYVNDAIRFRMSVERPLKYSSICYGTTDAIAFWNDKLRIHDYKSGVIPAKMTQLEIYAALFCLEYQKQPEDLFIELRIYQNGEIVTANPPSEIIRMRMDQIIHANDVITSFREREG